MKTKISYKAFDENLRCRGFQYEVGKEYTHDGEVVPRVSGFHSCYNPLDVLDYYDIIDSRFAQVTIDKSKKDGNETASQYLKVDVELNLSDFIKKAVSSTLGSCNKKTSGNYTPQASSGDCTKQASSGDDTKQASSGNYTKQASSGDCTKQASSGDDTKQASSGDYTKQASSGNCTKQASSGNYTKQASSGDYTKHKITGKYGVAVSSGYCSSVCGVKGTLVALTHFEYGVPKKIVTGRIGYGALKEENVNYGLDENGKWEKK